MVLESLLYKEMYKFTDEYKNKESDKKIKRYIFKESDNSEEQPSVNSTDGFNIIDSNILYDVSGFKIVPNSKINISNYSSPKNRFINKNIKITNIPLSDLFFNGDICQLLNNYLLNSIYIDENGKYKSSMDWYKYSLNSMQNIDLEYIYKYKNIPTKYLYGLQFSSIEFQKATGMLITIFGDKLESNLELHSYKIPNFDNNIKISLLSKSFLEIEFNNEYREILNSNVYNIHIYNNINSISKISAIPEIIDEKLLIYYRLNGNDVFQLLHDDIVSDNISEYEVINLSSDLFTYKTSNAIKTNEIYISSIPSFIDENSTIVAIANSISINYILKNNEYEILLDNNENGNKLIKTTNISKLSNYNITDLHFELFSFKNNYNNEISELHDIVPNTSYYETGEDIEQNENNIVDCLPFYLQKILEKNSSITYSRINEVLTKNIVLWNGIPCLKFTLDSKHDNILLFKDNRLVTPTYIDQNNGSSYDIYIQLTNEFIFENKTNYAQYTTREVLINKNNMQSILKIISPNLYIVYDVDRLFIENMMYDVHSIYKYIDLDNTTQYKISDTGDSYEEDENGEYIKYNNYYLILSNDNYILNNSGQYVPVPAGYTGKIYNKIKTNEYLLPINKDIDINEIVISVEDDRTYPENVQTHFIHDPNGAYVYLSSTRYYSKIVYNESDKLGLYILIDGEYILYDPEEHSEYDGMFYIKLTEGYHIPPYYYMTDIRYRKLGRKCIQLSNVMNLHKIQTIVSSDTYKEETVYNIVSSPVDKSGLYILIDGEYILYDPEEHSEYDGNFYAKQVKIIEGKTYDNKNELINDILMKKFGYFSMEFVYYQESNNVYKLCDINTPLYVYIKKEPPIYDKSNLYIYINNEYVKYNHITHRDYTGDFYIREDYPKYYYTPNNPTSQYTNKLTIDEYIKNISEFYDYNMVYKFILDGGEILDGGFVNTDEYFQVVDFGTELSFTDYSEETSLTKSQAITRISQGLPVYIVIDDQLVLYNPDEYPDYNDVFFTSSNFTYTSSKPDFGIDKNENEDPDDDYDIYDFNFSSPYSIPDNSIRAYRIDSSYNNYFINDEDENYLAYIIPNQLINSENKLMTFLNGKFSDEYEINKKLYSRLFGGDTILSMSYDPEDIDSDEGYHIDPEGDIYIDPETNEYIYDPNRDMSVMERVNGTLYYKVNDLTKTIEIDYIECYAYDQIEIVNKQRYIKFPDEYVPVPDDYEPEEGEILYYKLLNGYYIEIENYIKPLDRVGYEIENLTKYFQLKKPYNESYFVDTISYYYYTTSYSKNLSSVFMTNMKNMCLYQNQNGIIYENGIFTVSNNLDGFIKNERQIYKDIYFPPLSTKYMLFFINGRFANDSITIITPTTFTVSNEFVSNLTNTSELEINQIHIYVYDKFLYNLKYYRKFFDKEDVFLQDSATHNFVIADDNQNENIGFSDVQQLFVNSHLSLLYYIKNNNKYVKTTDPVILADSTIQKYVKVCIDYSVYKYNDTLWNNYSDYFKSKYGKSSFDGITINYNPKDIGYNAQTDLVSLYEIFGKYILNKYDIDSDPTLYDEIHEYFALLFDKNNRMKLELLTDSTKRKFIY